jgi:UDP-glucuronate 4-epimerase
MKHALITGGAGFIGSHLADSLLAEGWRVTVLDSFHPFYAPALKEANVAAALRNPRYALVRGDLRDEHSMGALEQPYDVVVHLAARAGVRASIEDPVGYQDVNVAGTQQVLELARRTGVRQFVFASSSSVYGLNPRVPWREDDGVLQPISPYASTKVSGELLGHVYSHLYGLRFLALRFFTVYGPRQRPDLAIHKFARLMLAGRPIPVYGDGTTSRDYTFIDDVIQGVRAAIEYTGSAYEVINLGNTRTVALDEMIAGLERVLGVKAVVERHPEQPGDVPRTWANVDKARTLLGYRPETSYEEGVERFARWLQSSTFEMQSTNRAT